MEILSIAILIIYGVLLTFILCYALVQFGLIINYRKKVDFKTLMFESEADKPFVTVQLPIYNEKYVVERLIDCIAALDYPTDKLEIQVLDDSTDETSEIIEKKVIEVQSKGIDIIHIKRNNREGYKAGALAEATEFAIGEFIAIFDADFLPEKDFLNNTLPYFKDSKVGVVQTKWKHLNEDFSILTKLQAFGLNAHFSVEQTGRNRGGHFINFNGTAGVWRKSTIEDAGGWQADTLTEDLDLSYRAQLKGWKFVYLEQVGAPAELPAAMNALKTQQYRWTKGAAECAKKNLVSVLKNRSISLKTKVNALFHLMNSFLFVCIVLLGLFSIPLTYIKLQNPQFSMYYNLGAIYIISLLILILFYWTSEKNKSEIENYSLSRFVIKFPLFLSFSMGLSLHNAIAVIEGYMGRKTPFIRTPKLNIKDKNVQLSRNEYLQNVINPITILEGVLAFYFIFGIVIDIKYSDYGLLPLHVLLTIGFSSIFSYSILHSVKLIKR